MNDKILSMFDDVKLNGSTNMEEIQKVEDYIGIKFPDEYKEFIAQYNGVGATKGNVKIKIWPIDRIVQYNIEIQV